LRFETKKKKNAFKVQRML